MTYSFSVPARTLSSILKEVRAPKYIDFLSLDVEGSEMLVLKGIDHNYTRFRYILLETRNFDVVNDYLAKYSYKFVSQFTQNDYLFSNSETLK
jgi:hypothetical protein